MAVQATYEVHIDLNTDRDFSDTNEDVSAYWKRMKWSLGVEQPYAAIARAATLEVVLNNEEGRFSPEHASGLSGFAPGALVRVRTTYDSTTRRHFIGWIDKDGIRPAPGTRGKRETIVRASGWMSRVQDAEAFLEVQEGKRTDEIIAQLIKTSHVYPPGITGWIVGHPVHGRVGKTTVVSSGVDNYTALDEGQTTLNYAGDNWEEGVSVYRAAKDVVEAEGEGALLYVDRAGKLTFWSRHHVHKDMLNAIDATLTQDDIKENGFRYSYGSRVVNDLTLSLRPRTVDDETTTLGRLDNPVRVNAGETRTVRFRYDDGSDNRIGGKNVSMGSWSAKVKRDGGADFTSQVDVSLEEGATGAEVTFTNNADRTVYIQAGATVEGVRITDYGHQEVAADDSDSIVAYGRHKEQRSLRLLDDMQFAEGYADWLIKQRKDPAGEIEAITLVANRSDALMTQTLARTIGDRIAISEGQTGSDGAYFIVGEQHRVNSQYEHLVTWTLRPAPANTYWIVGTSKVGVGTRVAF